MVDVDLHKAYDTVDRWVKEMALRRLGLEYEFIDYLLEFDRRNVQQVQTAYGPSTEFCCERGTVPQGGVESCLVYVAVADWMLATMKRRSEEPVPMPDGAGGEVQVDATCFADDVSLYQGSLRAAGRRRGRGDG